MLTTYTFLSDLQKDIKEKQASGMRVGFVPTMGALHNGHLSLIKQAQQKDDYVVCSIFVNPTQFNDHADFDLYPRTIERDKALLDSVNCDVLFLPSVSEIYPNESVKKIDFNPTFLTQPFEGASRPGHFEGMMAVVKRLLEIVKPDDAWFGQKDYQQYLIVKALAAHYFPEITIQKGETIREESGLAMSSRNERLTESEKKDATLIHKVLQETALALKEKKQSITEIKAAAIEQFEKKWNFTVDYFDICNAESLIPLSSLNESYEKAIILTAVKVGKVRLIDNILVE